MRKGEQVRATLTINEVSQQLGIGKNQAYEAAARGDIPSIRIGKRVLVPRAAFEQMLKDAAKTPAAA